MDAAEPESNRPQLEWTTRKGFSIAGVRYECLTDDRSFSPRPDRFCIRKPPDLVKRYAELLADTDPARVVELGPGECGSTALIAQLARPERLLAVDSAAPAGEALDGFLEERRISGVTTHWGTDQIDGEQLVELIEREIGSDDLDLVVDDGSRMLEPSRRSFEALFPLLRPNGIYVIEGWPGEPQGELVTNLVVAAGHRPELIGSVAADQHLALVRRGIAPMKPDELRVEDLVGGRW